MRITVRERKVASVMKNSLSIEYALHSLLTMAMAPPDTSLTIKQLAGVLGVTPSYLAKIYTQLAKSGMIRTSVGSKGGVSLAKAPEDITFYDVFIAVNGPLHLFQCHNIRALSVGYMPSPGMCEIHAAMWEAEDKMFSHLKQVTIADIAGKVVGKFTPEQAQEALGRIQAFLQQ
jgi:Rrf2 family protein